jgi:ATP-dependent protease ClpP protease subunit
MEQTTQKDWFKVKNTSETASEIYIMGDIVDEQWTSEEVSPTWFKNEFDKVKNAKHIHIFINSSGGSVFAALAIHNMIKNSKAFVTSHVMGIAASAASWMIMPSNKIVMPKNAFMMLHLPSTIAYGNKNDFRKTADFLDKVEDVIVDSYMRGGKKLTKETVTEMLNAGETWLNGQQAFDKGLIDLVEEDVAVANKGDYVVINGVEHDVKKYKSFPKVEETKKDKVTNLDEYVKRIYDVKKKVLNLKKETLNV